MTDLNTLSHEDVRFKRLAERCNDAERARLELYIIENKIGKDDDLWLLLMQLDEPFNKVVRAPKKEGVKKASSEKANPKVTANTLSKKLDDKTKVIDTKLEKLLQKKQSQLPAVMIGVLIGASLTFIGGLFL